MVKKLAILFNIVNSSILIFVNNKILQQEMPLSKRFGKSFTSAFIASSITGKTILKKASIRLPSCRNMHNATEILMKWV